MTNSTAGLKPKPFRVWAFWKKDYWTVRLSTRTSNEPLLEHVGVSLTVALADMLGELRENRFPFEALAFDSLLRDKFQEIEEIQNAYNCPD